MTWLQIHSMNIDEGLAHLTFNGCLDEREFVLLQLLNAAVLKQLKCYGFSLLALTG